MQKRYQVFVSSTYEDLIEERREVMHVLLESGCIPAGMELFQADDDDQWTLIKRVIDESDYYLVIIAGKYGSIGKRGKSFTEMEYRYALEQDKPIVGFVHAAPDQLTKAQIETEPTRQDGLDNFRLLVMKKMCKSWHNKHELGGMVSRSINNLMNTKPGIGWVRANGLPDSTASEEILSLRNENDTLKAKLQQANIEPIPGTENLSQGNDEVAIPYTYLDGNRKRAASSMNASWNEILRAIGPRLYGLTKEYTIREVLAQWITKNEAPLLGEMRETKVEQHEMHVILNQFTALKVIERRLDVWTLSERGNALLGQLLAVQRPHPQ